MKTKHLLLIALPALCLLAWWFFLRKSPQPPAAPMDYANAAVTPVQKNPASKKSPALEVIAGDNQTGSPGAFLREPLAVKLTDTDGEPLFNVPVTFAVSGTTGGKVATSNFLGPDVSITIRTDIYGKANAQFQLPAGLNTTSHITATYRGAVKTFSEATDDGDTAAATPPPGSEITVVENEDGSIDASWPDNGRYPNGTPVNIRMPDGTWNSYMAPPGATSIHIAAPTPTPAPAPPAMQTEPEEP